MAIKLIALDLDGTLTNDDKQITGHTRETLRRAAERGVTIALASGRPTLGVAPVADSLELDKTGGCVMAYNGGQIINWKTREIISAVSFNRDYIPEAVAFARRYGMPILTYSETQILSEGPVDRWAHREEVNCGMNITVVPDLVEFVDFPIVKMMLTGDPEALKVPEREMAEYFSGRLDIYRAEPQFLEIMPRGINKAAGLRTLSEALKLTRDEVMACGDANNDIPLLEFAGIGVAVANASEGVKAVADYITRSNNEDGVAFAVEKFVL